ncbi:unnamed protein product [Sphenostylis stenocarpa]|uniref:Uncharacterized protein n=1 Tax=Sphenostylis stenocarpa TaxID=92480 RepID=A0AA86VFA7_9FABA|nr:unnamed protein product [Sphenostylis stenocarpa]
MMPPLFDWSLDYCLLAYEHLPLFISFCSAYCLIDLRASLFDVVNHRLRFVTHVLWYGGHVISKTNAGMQSDSDALWFRAYLFFLASVESNMGGWLSIGYDDLSCCKFSSPDDCVKFVLGSSLGVFSFLFFFSAPPGVVVQKMLCLLQMALRLYHKEFVLHGLIKERLTI